MQLSWFFDMINPGGVNKLSDPDSKTKLAVNVLNFFANVRDCKPFKKKNLEPTKKLDDMKKKHVKKCIK